MSRRAAGRESLARGPVDPPPVPRLRYPRAVLFDVGDTLLAERNFDLAAGIQAVTGDAEMAVALALEFRDELVARHREGRELLLGEWLRARVPTLRSSPLDTVEDALWPAVVTLSPLPGIAEVLARLAADAVPAAAVSNAVFSARLLRAELERHGLAHQLRFVLSSGDHSTRKPGLAIFEEACLRLGARASDTWFVGNSLADDMVGALGAGLEPIWFGEGASLAAAPPGVTPVRDWKAFAARYESARRARV